ncbi:3-deoxy-D-manno-octulosonic acid transferase GT30 [Halomonadaceae bacterium LMG 33818]|uniref:lipid IV(A) 3-deoxy-D-manno-octulosonic acid transferase n=1 Tax=Cernens ardua TaxID=3402176 RepID=UPI003EDC7F82
MARVLYNTLIYALSPFVWKRVWHEQLPDRSRKERLGWVNTHPDQRVLWVHAASVGEVMTAVPVVRALMEDNPDHRMVITTMTATGAQRVAELFGDSVEHHFVALDFPRATRRLVKRLDPELLVIVETELWPNLIHAVAHHHVPIALINARISERSFHRYLRFHSLVESMLIRINWVAVKSGEDGKRFRALGMPAKRITVAGALKYDVVVPIEAIEKGKALRQKIGPRPVWIAASVREGEEAIVLDAHKRILQSHPDTLLIMVPRHPQRFDEVAVQCEESVGVLGVSRRSLNEPIPSEVSVYLADTMGELLTLYNSADISFVGGSLVSVGGHNLLEPAAMGLPVISGPELSNIREVADQLEEHHALHIVSDAKTLSDEVLRLIDDNDRRTSMGKAAHEVVEANRGAAERIRERLLLLVHPEKKENFESEIID